MAIRFPCGACAQPIEVDDEWAMRQVACPYCHTTITAPSESTLGDPTSIPAATPLGPPEAVATNVSSTQIGGAPLKNRNHLAIVAAVLVGLSLVCFLGFASIMSSHAADVQRVMQRADELTKDGTGFVGAIQRAWMEFYENNGGVPPDWMLGAIVFEFGGFFAWVVGLICAIIASFRPARKWLALSALLLACLMPFLFCVVTGSVM